MTVYTYMVRCSDGSYYVGSTRASLDQRIAAHNAATYGGFTSSRRPVKLVWYQDFERIDDAIAAERQVKGWSRAKKEALIRGDFAAISRLGSRARGPHPSRRPPSQSLRRAPQDEVEGVASPMRPEGTRARRQATQDEE